ncbi:flagellar type III secretion system pore protein FliP [Roseospira visakhapatnamensis]|uniref:Flagellar biosynthetic protein FliP n=1 Tax=Roseospira visakhapatnamensis TaxID=390880 RepID=A0A7W6RE93_9PROT|nr:flagellar type III secretion system pore protein FliP [Roseospira visakhapatnamensis]MBB4266429.1 flagellar biosynthetic protein FliP [Roseospira visakhapatnamensis]
MRTTHAIRVLVAMAAAGALVMLAGPALAQTFSLDLGGGEGTVTGRIIQMVALITVLSVAPSILLMATSFTRLVVVFSILRHAMGTQSTPPNMVLISLSMFMTAFIMAPTVQQSWEAGIAPLINEQVEELEAFERAVEPFRAFMLRHTRGKDLELMLTLSEAPVETSSEDASLLAVVPAFMISELRRAFEIGFLIYVPFIVIDMVIASVLMSMGMMMLPPMMLALPFKLVFFVLVDGWYLVVGSLVQSFGEGGEVVVVPSGG